MPRKQKTLELKYNVMLKDGKQVREAAAENHGMNGLRLTTPD